MIPDRPPEWTRRAFGKFFKKLTGWLYESQAIPGVGMIANETPAGRRLSVDISKIPELAAASAFRLQLINASTATSPKVRVRLGKVAGRIADAGMTDPGDDPPFELTLASSAGWKYIYCDVTLEYDGTTNGNWTSTDCEISSGASIPSDDATHAYVEIGTAHVSAVSGGYVVDEIPPQSAQGDQWCVRPGGSSSITHANGTIG